MADPLHTLPSNIPNPDPSVVANERLAESNKLLRAELAGLRAEVKNWVDTLQTLLEQSISGNAALTLSQFAGFQHALNTAIVSIEEKIHSSEDKTASLDRVVQTRLAGSETALNAAMAASDKVVAKIETGVGAVMSEMKQGFSKQLDSLKDNIDELKKRIFESGGRSEGMGHLLASGVSIVVAVTGVIAVIVSVVIFMSRSETVHQGSIRAPASIAQPF